MAPVVVSRSDRIVRRTVMVGAVTAAYFLLTADYGPYYPNPIRKAMESSALFSKTVSNDNAPAAESENKQGGKSWEPDGGSKK